MSLSPFHLQASPIHAGLFFSSVRLSSLPTRHFPIASSLISPVSVSAQLQLSSAWEQHTHTFLSHTHLLALALAHQQHILTVGGTARQDRHYLFIVLVAWMSSVCVHCTRCTHTHTHTDSLSLLSLSLYMCTHINIKKNFIVLGLGVGLAARCRPGPRPCPRPRPRL